MKPWTAHIPDGAWPRRMPGAMAAAYRGVSYATFKAMVERGEMPPAAERIKDRKLLWDRREIDAYLDGRNAVSDPIEDTKRDLEQMYG